MLRFLKVLLFNTGPKYDWKKVTLWVTLSCFSISGSATACYLFYRYTQHAQVAYASCEIRAIVQTSPQTRLKYTSLQTAYLAEILGLSVDHPIKLGEFDLDIAKKRLLATHAILDVRLKKMKPDVLFIQYSMRAPFAFLEDYTNTALDEEGTLFPYAPFYPPRHLPRIYLGEKRPLDPWGTTIEKNLFDLAQNLMTTLGYENIERVDLSRAEADSSGQREIIILLKEGALIRLSPKNYGQQLLNYSILKRNFTNEVQGTIIDLRIPEVAYIQKQ